MKAALQLAEAALAEHEPARALSLLLLAWREKRCARLADLIDRISKDLAAAAPSLVKKPLSAQWAEWTAVADARKPEDFDRLVAVPMPRKWTEAEPRFRQLYAWGEDPRLSRFLASVIATNAIYAKGSDARASQVEGFYFRLMKVLVELRDHRALKALEDARVMNGQWFLHWRTRRAEFAKWLRAVPVPEETPEEAELLDRLLGPLQEDRGAQTAEALLARIHENPDDLGARGVYADLLTEQGDPRGELITLQLSEKRNLLREKTLLSKHGRLWAGGIGGWFRAESRIFEHGFLAGGRLAEDYGVKLDEAALAVPEWRLIRELDLPLRTDVKLLMHPHLAWLRRLTITEENLPELMTRTWPLESLIAGHWRETVMPSPHPLSEAAAFPALKTLGVHDIPDAAAEAWRDWLPTAPVLKRLERVVLDVYAREAKAWWAPMSASAVAELQFGRGADWVHTFTRDARGALGRLRCTFQYRLGTKARQVEYGLHALLEALPPGALTAISIERNLTTKKLDRGNLEAALAKFPQLTEAVLPWH